MSVSGVLQIVLKVNDTYDSFSVHIHIICSKFKICSAWKIMIMTYHDFDNTDYQ